MHDESRPLLDHLEEIRRRLWSVLICGAFFFCIALFFADRIIEFLAGMTGGLVFLHPTEAFLARLKVSCYLAGFFSLPIIFFQVWSFVKGALKPSEKKGLGFFMWGSYFLFLSGIGLSWGVILPVAFKYLLGFSSPSVHPLISIDYFLSFTFWLTIAFGVMFEIPLALLFLVKIGVIEPKTLANIRPYVVVGLAITAGVLTPGPDFFSQLALLIPTYILYEAAVFAARWMHPVDIFEEGLVGAEKV